MMQDAKQAIAWRPLLAIAAVPVLVHLVTAGSYGIFRDEYYYLACARHLDWGYVDHPPLSMAVLAAIRAIFGEGILALRLVPALCGGITVVLAGRLAAALGGGRYAQFTAAVSAAVVGVMLAISGFYSMNALDLVFWAGAWLLLARWAATPSPRLVIGLGLWLGLGLQNKIGLLVLGAALAVAVLLTPLRRWLLTPAPYIGAALALLVFAPHLIWQATHGWPTLEFMSNARQYKISAMSPPDFMGEVLLEQNPFNLLVWPLGLGWLLLARRARSFRVLGLTVVFGLAILMAQGAKPYYAAGLFPVLLAAGACAWEAVLSQGWRRRLRFSLPAVLATGGLLLMPMVVPVLSPGDLARWQVATGIAPAPQEVGHTSELPQHFSDRFGWEKLAAEMGRIVASLPEEERRRAVIIARNYGEAGALEYWSETHDLPRVVSGHNSYWFWQPRELSLDTVIVVGWRREQVEESFGLVERAGTLQDEWALENGLPIWLAREPKLAWSALRERIRFFI